MRRLSVFPLLSAFLVATTLLGGCLGATPWPAVQVAATGPPAEQPSPEVSSPVAVMATPGQEVQAPGTLGLTPDGAQATSTPSPAATAPALSGAEINLPYRAWAVAPTGQFYLLDASGLVYRFSPDLTRVLDASGPLFDTRDPGPSHMAMSDEFLILSSERLTRTLVLERESFARRGELYRAGPVAIDGSGRLFLLADGAAWAYDLQDLGAPPVPVTKWPVDPFTPRPRNLAVDAKGGQLLVTLHDVSASPPHQQEWYAGYDLDTLQLLRTFPGQLGELTRPSVGGDSIVAGMAAKNGFLGSSVVVFDREGRVVRAAQPFAGRPIVDAQGEWIYVLGDRGTWIMRASDLGLVGLVPFAAKAPVDLLLSPDGSKLYSVSDGYLGLQETSTLRSEGVLPLRGILPPNWFDSAQTDFLRPRFYPVPGSEDTAYVEVGGYGESWRTRDGGATWEMLPGLVYPSFHYVTHLSISPDFAHDETIVAVAFSTPTFLRSTDGGDSWSAWDPPIAFVSDRDGNREIYTADRGKLGGGTAQNLVRRTDNPAADENPAWSPGWSRIAFQSNRNGNWDIFTMRAGCDPNAADAETECDLRQITNDPADDMLPAWSPDGRWIALVSMRDGMANIYLVSTDGGPAQRVTTSSDGAWRPAWLPDVQRLMYTATRGDGSNDIAMGRIVEGVDGSVSLSEALPVVDSEYDERDAAVGRELFVYLSNETGMLRTYGRYNYDQATSFPFTIGAEPEGHPTLLEDGTNTVLVTLVRDGQTGIYRANTSGYEPFLVDGSFNGQPAAGPVPWQPSADWSQERARAWQR